MNLLRNLCPKQTIRTLSFVFFASHFLNVFAHAQGVTPPQDYFRNIEIADSLSNQKNYKAATEYYTKAIKAFGGRALPDDRYNAARAWGYAGSKDSAFALLEHLATKSRYWNYQRFADDPAFKSFTRLYRFSEIASSFQANKEKYYPEINVEFYNALDSIHTEAEQNRKMLALAKARNENVLLLNKQIHNKDSADLQRVIQLLDKHGWPDSVSIGFYGNYTLNSLIRQSHRPEHAKYRGMMAQAIAKNNPAFNLSLAITLDSILTDDQHDRMNVQTIMDLYGPQSKQLDSLNKRITYYDSINLIKVKQIIDTYGWPGSDVVGFEGNLAIFLVIQHADLATQEKYLPMVRDAVKTGKARAGDLALLEDRVLTRNGKAQIYGSQLRQIPNTNKYEFYPIEDEANVNKRRAAIGLQPLEDYAKGFGISYTPIK
ncbi:DUF6624 domain-containing protein [Pinibacter aurantiacus]|uniref:Tetratricopeptide repeat protein n=1 Tax=Pinibacter aurantiacus TaxID=2851599 RepID=A0A9E2SBG0_9BACT|nr:DUF6624 domain-containing protein [Pinibacter aurantiacus]MBV4358252.1 hypothetical protein [Pinibacter aurantiacus]